MIESDGAGVGWGWGAAPPWLRGEEDGGRAQVLGMEGLTSLGADRSLGLLRKASGVPRGRVERRPHRLPWAEGGGEMALSRPWPPDADLEALRAKKGGGRKATRGCFPHQPFRLLLP